MSEEQNMQASEPVQPESDIPSAAPQAQQGETFDLTVQDLNAIKVIIDAAAQRGSFKPAEMEVVGKTYNKLVGFLSTVTKGAQNG